MLVRLLDGDLGTAERSAAAPMLRNDPADIVTHLATPSGESRHARPTPRWRGWRAVNVYGSRSVAAWQIARDRFPARPVAARWDAEEAGRVVESGTYRRLAVPELGDGPLQRIDCGGYCPVVAGCAVRRPNASVVRSASRRLRLVSSTWA